MKMKSLAAGMAAIILGLCATSCAKKAKVYTVVPKNPGIFIPKSNTARNDFIRGVDVSTVIAEEESGVVYKGWDGQPQDLFKTLRESGVNYIRVRVWNDPWDENGNSFGGGHNDLDTAIEIGKRAAKYKLPLLVDFHYSDFWADPNKQKAPREWADMGIEEKQEALYDFTKSSLKKLIKSGAIVGMVQIGNETTTGMAGEKNWMKVCKLMNAGAKAVREVSKDIKVVVHFTNPEKAGEYEHITDILAHNKVDYDVFGTSDYPYWHLGTKNLAKLLDKIADKTGKQVMVCEFSSAYTYGDGDDNGNSISEDSYFYGEKNYSTSVQGQADVIYDYINDLSALGKKCLGVFWWEPAWIPVPGKNREERQALWEKHGSGWASSFATAYDPDDAGKYYGGSAWDNQALFDYDGKPLASLAAWGLASVGGKTDVRPDFAQNVEIRARLGESVNLPSEVEVTNNDGSASKVGVKWNDKSDDGIEIAKLTSFGPKDFKVHGIAGGNVPVLARVSAIELNFVENPSFEDKDISMWEVQDMVEGTNELKVMDKADDAKTGSKAFHWWSEKEIHFTIRQTVKGLKPGLYKASMQIHGGDNGPREEQEIFLFAASGGKNYKTYTFTDGWRSFFNPAIMNIYVGNDGECVIGADISGLPGSWGSVDDFVLTPQK
ncbi:MAG: glycosyl hydrolase 53 family protein [Treponema sp.]|nr:glycosyl hydrolase 53 family protein [Treponema sp.]